ncbi:MAG: metallophosphoesterase [Verrucomicrobiota bacterium]
MKRRSFLTGALIGTPLALGGALAYGRHLERHRVEVVSVEVSIGLVRPVTVCVLGDIHFDPLYETDYLRDVVGQVNSLAPDRVWFTGDFLTRSPERLDELAEPLSEVKASLGVAAVLGNHDHWVAPDDLSEALENVGIEVLRNRSIALPESPGWYLSGLESYWGGVPSSENIDATAANARHILLAHEPDPFRDLRDERVVLQVSGHTHGGQVRVPGFGALQLPSWGRRYQMGLYRENGRTLYVNRGVGTVDHHYRFNCPPEITHLRLV